MISWRRRHSDVAPGTEPASDAADGVMVSPPAVDPASGDLAAVDPAAERAALIELCLYALDRARSPGVTERLESGLAEIGVLAVRPDGDRFDPAAHEAGGVVATEDAELVGLVAETELVGFVDRGTVLRVPVVTVYQL